MKNIIIVLVCGLFLANCSNRYVLGTKCTNPDKLTGAYEKSFIWSVDRTMSDDAFGKRKLTEETIPTKYQIDHS